MAAFIGLSTQPVYYNNQRQPGAKIYVYNAGTNTPRTTYADGQALTANAWPLIADANGCIPVFWVSGTTSIKVQITTASDVVVRSIDDIAAEPVIDAGGGGGGGESGTTIPVGFLLAAHTTGFVSGWVRANGRTIGNAVSGASERANADTADLFAHLWEADPLLAVSGGRGANAALDFAAGKTIELPDWRGRVPVGLADMGNTNSGRLAGITFTQGSATTLGAAGGYSTHTLTTNEIPVHNHVGSTASDGVHTHTGPTDTAGGHTHVATATTAGSHTHTGTVDAAGGHTHGGSLGNDGYHDHSATSSTAGSHSHTGSTSSGGSHTHSGSTDSQGSHTHPVSVSLTDAGTHAHGFTGVGGSFGAYQAGGYAALNGLFGTASGTGDAGLHNHVATGTVSAAGSHTHSVTILSGGDHSHTVSTNVDGSHSHTLVVGGNGTHTHSLTIFSEPNHNHTFTTAVDGSHTHTVTNDAVADHTHSFTTQSSGSHTHAVTINNTGGGTAHNNMQPFMTCTWYIKL